MIRTALTIAIFHFIFWESSAQLLSKNTASTSYPTSSKMVQLTGQVKDIHSALPINAKIIFRKLPHSDNVGVFNNDLSTGDYSFSVVRNGTYTIEITAKGYFPISELVDATDMDPLSIFEKDFWMMPIEKGRQMVLDNLQFEHNESDLADESLPVLDLVVSTMLENPYMTILLEGHTSQGGSESFNLKLSEARVRNIKKYIVEQGVTRSRIETAALGSSQPVMKGNTPEARKANRRVEITILDN